MPSIGAAERAALSILPLAVRGSSHARRTTPAPWPRAGIGRDGSGGPRHPAAPRAKAPDKRRAGDWRWPRSPRRRSNAPPDACSGRWLSRPVRCGPRGSSPGRRGDPRTRARRPTATGRGRPCGTACRRHRAEVVGQETFVGQIRAIEVAAGDRQAADYDFARLTRLHRAQIGVDEVDADALDRASDRGLSPPPAAGGTTPEVETTVASVTP